MNLKRLPQQLQIPALTSAFIEGLPTLNIPLDRQQYLWGVLVDFYGRLTIGGANGAAVNAEAPQNLFRRIRVTQNHEIFGSKMRVNRTGASLFRMYQAFNGTMGLNASTPALAVGMANYDLHLQLCLPFVLPGLSERATIPFLLDAPRCGALNLEIDLAHGADLVQTGGATTWTWSAFGGGGNPSLYVTLLQVNGLKHLPKTAMVAFLDRVDSLAAANAIDNQIGNDLRLDGALARLWLKQYVQDAAQQPTCAATMNSPDTPAASGLVHPQFFIDAKSIRDYRQWTQLEAENKQDRQLEAWPTGYGLVDFVEDGDLREIVPAGDLIKTGHKLGIGGLNNALANGQLETGWDLLYPNPQI